MDGPFPAPWACANYVGRAGPQCSRYSSQGPRSQLALRAARNEVLACPARQRGRQARPVHGSFSTRKNNKRPKFEVASDFHLRIRKAREAIGISVQDLGRRLNMRVQDLQRYEGGSVPPDSVAKKLERELKIEIMVETDTDNATPVRKGSGRTVTIADMFDEMMRDSSNG